MSKIETNTIAPSTGTTLTVGESVDTVKVGGTAGTGFGKVLQVINAVDSSERSTTSTSYVTGSNTLTVNITPTSTSNKILILVSTTIGNTGTGYTHVTCYNGSTNLATANGFIEQVGFAGHANGSFHFYDSPSSLSQQTYQVYFKTSSNTAYLNAHGTKGSITVMEIGA